MNPGGRFYGLDMDAKPPTWTARDGRSMTLPAMADEHVVNALIFCIRRVNQTKQGSATMVTGLMAVATFAEEVRRRGLHLKDAGLARRVQGLVEGFGGFDERQVAKATAPVSMPRFHFMAPGAEELN